MTVEAKGSETAVTLTGEFELPRDFGGAMRMNLANRLYVASLDSPESFEGCEPESVFNLPGSEQAVWLRVADEAIAALVESPAA